jgi:hypothetical protein
VCNSRWLTAERVGVAGTLGNERWLAGGMPAQGRRKPILMLLLAGGPGEGLAPEQP